MHKCIFSNNGSKCNEMAVWMYMPNSHLFYCEKHVPRGCSCNILDNGEMDKDDLGRDLPCCEYNYSESGFSEDEDQITD